MRLLYFKFNLAKYLIYKKYFKLLNSRVNNLAGDSNMELLDKYLKFMLQNNQWVKQAYSDLLGLNSVSLSAFGITKKSDLRYESEETLISKGIDSNDLLRNSTSGSTGEPFVFFSSKKSKKQSPMIVAALYDIWNGNLYSGKVLSIWSHVGCRLDYPWYVKPFKRNFTFDVDDLSVGRIRDILKGINRNRIEILRAYPSTIYYISLLLESELSAYRSLLKSIKLIQTGGEKLYEFQENLIKKTFGADVIDMYGSREVSLLLSRLPGEIGYYPVRDDVFIEVVDEAGVVIDNGVGRIIVTDMANFNFPILRYEIGDLARIENGKVTEILGRTFEVLSFKGGYTVGASFWTWLMRSDDGIRAFQVVQTSFDSIKINIVSKVRVNIGRLEDQIKERCGMIHITWNFVENIPNDTYSGKVQLVKKEFSNG